MEGSGALFHEDNDIDGLYALVGESLSLRFPDSVILTDQQVGAIAEAPLNGKVVSNALHFHIYQPSVCELYQNVHDEEGAFFRDGSAFWREDISDGHFLVQDAGKQAVQPPGMELWVEDMLEERVICNLEPPFSHTEAQEGFLCLGSKGLEDGIGFGVPAYLDQDVGAESGIAEYLGERM